MAVSDGRNSDGRRNAIRALNKKGRVGDWLKQPSLDHVLKKTQDDLIIEAFVHQENRMIELKIKPTPEVTRLIINGHPVDSRVWSGVDAEGRKVDAFIVSVVPREDRDRDAIAATLPAFMQKFSQVMHISSEGEERLCTYCFKPLVVKVEYDNCAHIACIDALDRIAQLRGNP